MVYAQCVIAHFMRVSTFSLPAKIGSGGVSRGRRLFHFFKMSE